MCIHLRVHQVHAIHITNQPLTWHAQWAQACGLVGATVPVSIPWPSAVVGGFEIVSMWSSPRALQMEDRNQAGQF